MAVAFVRDDAVLSALCGERDRGRACLRQVRRFLLRTRR